MIVYDLTNQLREELEYLKNRYFSHEKPENKRDRDFFTFVKEQTTPKYKVIKQWEKEALEHVKQRSIQVHPQQIVSTSENLELLLMHSYYIDARKKRYMELYKSVHYVFDLILTNDHGNTKE